MSDKSLFKPFVSFFCLLGICLIYSCTTKTSVEEIDPAFAKYISAFTYGNISPESYIQIELAQEMPSVALNTEIEEKLFSFSPTIKGKTYWINSSTLQFIPESGELNPGKKYRAKFHLDKVMKVGKEFSQFNFVFGVNEQNFTVEVLPYSPISINDLAWNSIPVTLHLSNAAGVDDVRDMFSMEGAPSQTVVRVSQNTATQFSVLIDSIPRTDTSQKFSLIVDGSPIGADKSDKFEVNIPAFSQDNFQVVDVRMQGGADSHLRITFSDPLSGVQDLRGLVMASGISNFTSQTEKNVLKIYPEKLPKDNVSVTVYQGIQNSTGLKLDKDYIYQLAVQGNLPEIKITGKGNILPNSTQLTLPFSAVNLWAVDVNIIKIYRNNILYYLQSGTLNNTYPNEIRRFGRLVMKKQIRLDEDKKLDLSQWNNFSINLASLIEQDPGALYLVRFSLKQEYSLYPCGGITPAVPDVSMRRFGSDQITEEDAAVWDEASPYYYDPIDWNEYKWEDRDDPCTPSYYMNRERMKETFVMASNIGIIAKSGDNQKMSIAVTDILTTQPLSGADVTIYNYQMQPIGTGKTDSEGFVDINYKNGKPFVATATKGDDTGYLELKEETSLSLSRFDVGGKEVQKGLKGYVYMERGVWRPGDSIFVSFILEDKDKKIPEGHPVSFELFTPRGQFYQRQVKSHGINGFFTFGVATDPVAETGLWQGVVKVGGTTFHKSLRVETIKPNRLKIRLEIDSVIDASKGVISGSLSSQWLHGSPASNLKAEIDLSLHPSEKPFNGYVGYYFNNPVVNFETSKTRIFEGQLNVSGEAQVNAKVPVSENAPGMLRGNILSRVYETGGDMSFYSQTVLYSPYETYVGVKPPLVSGGEFLETDQPILFDVVTVNAYGKKVSTSVEYTIYKLEWSWWWNSTGEDLGRYVNNTAANVVDKGDLKLTNGKGSIRFQVDYPDWGRYLIMVKDKMGKHITGTVFYVDWPSWRGRSAKTDPEGLTMLSFSTDKPTYEVGEKATVTIPKSSGGRVLISIENGSGIIHKEWVKTSSEEDTKYVVEVTEKMTPNFYVSATLLQPHEQEANDLPIRMYGVLNVGVENINSILTPVIRMPDTLHPEKEFTVSVSEKNKKPMTYTLAIVDEGLLDLTAFKTPNAWSEFYAREALGVRTWDLFDRVLDARSGLMGSLLSIGGDEALRPANDNINRFKPIVKFIGPFTLKSGQTLNHIISLPQYIGSVRVMVVAGGNGAYGSAEKAVTVKNELMTLSTLPRTMGPNEEVLLPVNIFAMEKSVKNVRVSIQTKGLLSPADGTSKSITFNKPGDQTIFFRLTSGNKTGAEQVVIKATGNGASFTETIDIAVRNPNPPVVISKGGLINAGQTLTLSHQTEKVLANDWATVEFSRLPSVDFSRNMNYLLEYPHGCTEQITSQAFPLLYVDALTSLTEDEKKKMTNKVDEVVRMLASRQLSDGSFVYWPGDHYGSEWVTTYAGHFLVEAARKGYEVPESVLSRWVQFQRRTAQNWQPTNSNSGYYSVSMTQLQQAYRLYALALNGSPELGAMNRMRELPSLSLQAVWRLAAAYVLAGKKDVAHSLVFNTPDSVNEYDFNNDTYGSSGRDMAMIMETYLLLDNVEKALALAPTVAQSLSSNYISTQTASFGLVSMAQLAEKMGAGNIDVEWTLNGKKMEPVNTPRPVYQVSVAPESSLSLSVTNRGSSKIYTRFSLRTQPQGDDYNYAVTQGNLILSVHYYDLDGKPIHVESLSQGAEFTAAVTVRNNGAQSFTDLALTQVFPSGWEILNERILSDDTRGGKEYNYRDIRDDRVQTYFNLGAAQTKTFKVQLQAAYKGRYYLPAVLCRAMYAPQEEARNKGSWVTVD